MATKANAKVNPLDLLQKVSKQDKGDEKEPKVYLSDILPDLTERVYRQAGQPVPTGKNLASAAKLLGSDICNALRANIAEQIKALEAAYKDLDPTKVTFGTIKTGKNQGMPKVSTYVVSRANGTTGTNVMYMLDSASGYLNAARALLSDA